MREILFRGKRIDNGEWVDGLLCQCHEGISAKIALNDFGVIDIGMAYCVEPSTIGQYTGLTDKNGVKIFEGDIVRYGDTVHRVVFEQRNRTAYFGLVYGPEETLPFGHYQDLRQIAIIGNIYDNSELMGGGT